MSGRHHPECQGPDAEDVPRPIGWLNAVATWIVWLRLVTLEPSQSPVGWLNAPCPIGWLSTGDHWVVGFSPDALSGWWVAAASQWRSEA